MQQVKVSDRLADISWQSILITLFITTVMFLALFNLTGYPPIWFDEGSHLHVPKTLVRFGVYADYSSEGFRYYGPTTSVGPTVMLPIATVFRFFGIGLLQARLVVVIYLLALIYVFYHLAYRLGGTRYALIATTLLIIPPGDQVLKLGRQVMGEVPGLFFLTAGLTLWFADWEKAGWRRLGLVGLLLGLATITKYQYLLQLAPALGLAWLANLVYYRTVPQRHFLIPGFIAIVCFVFWQLCQIVYLGPGTVAENLALLRKFTAGAALVFSPDLIILSIKRLLDFKVFLGWLPVVLAYGFFLALPRNREGQKWGLLLLLVIPNLVWYMVASIGLFRYAFPGLAIASLFTARFFFDMTDGFRLHQAALWRVLRHRQPILSRYGLGWTMLVWLAMMIVLPLGQTVQNIRSQASNAPIIMADYLNKHVLPQASIETSEPEMGFLTDHNYHFPPPLVQLKYAVHKLTSKSSIALEYDFVQTQQPDYILIGPDARWKELYPANMLTLQGYRLIVTVGEYELYTITE